MSGNTAKQKHQLIINVLRFPHQTKIMYQVTSQKQHDFFVVLQKIVMLRTCERQFLLHYIKKGQVLNYVIFITTQNYLDCSARTFLHISNGISFVSDKCIIFPLCGRQTACFATKFLLLPAVLL
jgi:hypothetical protein